MSLGFRDMTKWNLSQGQAAGGVNSTSEDMTTFIPALVTGELLQNAETLSIMQELVRANGLLVDYGPGLMSQTPSTWGHNGQTLGYESMAPYNVPYDRTVVTWTNSSENLAGLGALAVKDTLDGVGLLSLGEKPSNYHWKDAGPGPVLHGSLVRYLTIQLPS